MSKLSFLKALKAKTAVALSSSAKKAWIVTASATTDFSHVLEEGNKAGLSSTDSFIEWGKAYFSALSEKTARDRVSVNSHETIEAVIGGSIAAVSLFFSWRAEDKENFSKALGAIGVTSIIALNPVTAMVAVVGLAMSYNKQILKKDALVRGGVVSAIGMGVSALMPGRVLLGAVSALVVSMYANKKLTGDVVTREQVQQLLTYLRSDEFKNAAQANWKSMTTWLDARAQTIGKKTV